MSGEIVAVFKSLASDAADTAGKIGERASGWLSQTADAAEENADRTLAADSENASAFAKIRPNTGDLKGGDAGAADSGASGAGAGNRFSKLLGGGKSSADKDIDNALKKVNPKFDPADYRYSENCTGCVQANELLRRGADVEAGPIDKPGGRPISVISDTWGGEFKSGSKADIEKAFSEPGSRGVVYIKWNGKGAHVFNVENVDGNVRFIDGQPNPPVTDASSYFANGHSTQYIRLDDKPTPQDFSTQRYVTHNYPDPGPSGPAIPSSVSNVVHGAHAGATTTSTLLNTAESQPQPNSTSR